MNQILSVGNSNNDYNKSINNKIKKEKGNSGGGPADISSVLRFFAIALLIFGAFMMGSGSYSMYKENKAPAEITKPTIFIEEVSDTEKIIKVSHDKNLNKVTYKWNNDEVQYINSYGKKNVEEKIEVPSGENKLTVYASDMNGEETTVTKIYDTEIDDPDVGNLENKIDIKIENTINGVKVKVTADEELSYMTYRWNDEEETKVEINDISTEQILEAPKGLNKLTVIVVDVNNKTETKEQEVNAVPEPKVTIELDEAGENFVLKASDENGLKKMYIDIDEGLDGAEKYKQEFPEEDKEFEYTFGLHEGENRLKVKVYNKYNVMKEVKVKAEK